MLSSDTPVPEGGVSYWRQHGHSGLASFSFAPLLAWLSTLSAWGLAPLTAQQPTNHSNGFSISGTVTTVSSCFQITMLDRSPASQLALKASKNCELTRLKSAFSFEKNIQHKQRALQQHPCLIYKMVPRTHAQRIQTWFKRCRGRFRRVAMASMSRIARVARVTRTTRVTRMTGIVCSSNFFLLSNASSYVHS